MHPIRRPEVNSIAAAAAALYDHGSIQTRGRNVGRQRSNRLLTTAGLAGQQAVNGLPAAECQAFVARTGQAKGLIGYSNVSPVETLVQVRHRHAANIHDYCCQTPVNRAE